MQFALARRLEGAQHAPVLAKLQDPSCAEKAYTDARIMQCCLTVSMKASRVAGWVLFSAELFSEWGTPLDYCTGVSFICQAVCMASAEIPYIKNAMPHKKQASEFIGANRTEALGESISQRRLAFKSGLCGAAPPEGASGGDDGPLQTKSRVEQD